MYVAADVVSYCAATCEVGNRTLSIHLGDFVLPSNLSRIVLGFLLVLATCRPADAGFMTFKTVSGGTSESNPVSAQVTFDITKGVIKIKLYNLLADPLAANQAISGLLFKTSNPNDPGTVSISSSTGDLININADKTYSSLGTQSPLDRWHVESPTTTLIALGQGQPDHMIIGNPNANNLYASANSSITGGQFNPYVHYQAQFNLSASLVTDSTTIASVTFLFGTDANKVAGVEVVPEPTTLALCGIGAVVLLSRRLLRKRPAQAPNLQHCC